MTPGEWQTLAFFIAAIVGLAFVDPGMAKVTALAVGAVVLLKSKVLAGTATQTGSVL